MFWVIINKMYLDIFGFNEGSSFLFKDLSEVESRMLFGIGSDIWLVIKSIILVIKVFWKLEIWVSK